MPTTKANALSALGLIIAVSGCAITPGALKKTSFNDEQGMQAAEEIALWAQVLHPWAPQQHTTDIFANSGQEPSRETTRQLCLGEGNQRTRIDFAGQLMDAYGLPVAGPGSVLRQSASGCTTHVRLNASGVIHVDVHEGAVHGESLRPISPQQLPETERVDVTYVFDGYQYRERGFSSESYLDGEVRIVGDGASTTYTIGDQARFIAPVMAAQGNAMVVSEAVLEVTGATAQGRGMMRTAHSGRVMAFEFEQASLLRTGAIDTADIQLTGIGGVTAQVVVQGGKARSLFWEQKD